MRLRGLHVLVAIASTAFFAGHVGTSSATTFCLVKSATCPLSDSLAVPATIEAKMTHPYAVFENQTECELSNLKLLTYSNTGSGSPLLGKILSLKFGTCGTCPTATALGLPFLAELEALQDGSPLGYHGNGVLRILNPEIELSGCSPGSFACVDKASSIALNVTGGVPMKIAANSVSMNATGASSCGTSTQFSAEYKVTSQTELWLEPSP